ncbi:nitroreductase family protein [Sinanaerobacter chloroacetimidivorans]|jgi:nitroreductase|uniref:Nitroreductase family protein n=1 Tax=Sinanaerobacter chloroacetimidivorans TaxID=2818044 RepID=A0A8J7VYG2_9FIRM|nr:nitroreductase family protein [Sinanaerobacter chloroacetimidivorans]MBR0596991.1 nitroreductase family protein [Sinanaerobacter chloroacetimidivorans]
MNQILENIMTRRSIRKFRSEQITDQELQDILLAGSYAPSGMGLQTWKFTAIQGRDAMQKVNESIRQALLSIPVTAETHPYVASLIEKAKDETADFLYHAPTYIIVSNLKDSGNAMPDSALAIGNMMLAAHSLGVGSCWLNQLPGLTHMPVIRQLLNELDIPENHIIYGTVVLGYPADEPNPAAPRKDVINIIR